MLMLDRRMLVRAGPAAVGPLHSPPPSPPWPSRPKRSNGRSLASTA